MNNQVMIQQILKNEEDLSHINMAGDQSLFTWPDINGFHQSKGCHKRQLLQFITSGSQSRAR